MNSAPKKIPFPGHIRVIAPASSTKDWTRFPLAVRVFEELGCAVSFGKHVKEKKEYLAGTDAQRLRDLHAGFKDPTVDAIFCLRGGYGTTRLLGKLDFSLIKKNPKPVVGFSDITALQLALLTKANIGSYSAPIFMQYVKDGVPNELCLTGLLRAATVSGKKTDLLEIQKKYLKTVKAIRSGTATGVLVGGNLSMICALIGTPFFPNLKGKILFLEEVNEAPYKFDRLLTQLVMSGSLRGIKGIIVGQCAGCESAGKIVVERLRSYQSPVCHRAALWSYR